MSERDDEIATMVAKTVIRIIESKQMSFEKKVKELEKIDKYIDKTELGKEVKK